jgi:uncharacterized protein YdhG (YjbR/CyaY superfamily)
MITSWRGRLRRGRPRPELALHGDFDGWESDVIKPRAINRPKMRGKGGSLATRRAKPRNIDEYIAGFSPEVQAILERIRLTIRKAAPGARETISYSMPAFASSGILVYFAAFKNHIGLYPPVRGDATLEKAIARYAGEKGNLKFRLDEPIPYNLIERIVKLRVKQDLKQATAKGKGKR